MAVVYTKKDQGNSVTSGTGAPTHAAIAGDRYTDTTTTKVRCHKLIAPNLKAIFTDLLAHYGLAKIQELGIDLYGGCFNYRKMRGGSSWSKHAWGIAIDLSPAKNSMNTPVNKSQFNKPEYKPLIEIFERHGFEWGGKLWGKDAMHFQIKD